MPNCNCKGSVCGCSITAGTGINVSGSGTAQNPFVISRDTTGDSVLRQIKVTNTTSLRMKTTGLGTAADPLVLSGQVILTAPNGSYWALVVSNTGALSTTASTAPTA